MGSATATGDKVQLLWYLYADGSVRLWQTKNWGTQSDSGQSSAPAGGLASAWASGASVYVNSNGTGSIGQCALRRLKLLAGNLDFTTLQNLR
jgi:hypothetical protein